MTIPLQDSAVYGPIQSRRLGVSLGINLLPSNVKFCFSNCVYCQYGNTDSRAMRTVKLRPARELVREIEDGFLKHAANGLTVQVITFCGNGEPTLHPELKILAREVKILRDQYFPGAKVVILSDSMRVHLSTVRDALEEFDEKYMKLDSGDIFTFFEINRPVFRVNWEAMIDGLMELSSPTIQSMFISSPVDNSTGLSLKNWLSIVRQISPKAVHIYTVDRPSAECTVKPVSLERLLEISRMLRGAAGLDHVIPVTDTYVELV